MEAALKRPSLHISREAGEHFHDDAIVDTIFGHRDDDLNAVAIEKVANSLVKLVSSKNELLSLVRNDHLGVVCAVVRSARYN